MKRILALFCCLLFLFSCEMKKDLFGQGQGIEEDVLPENVGLLDLYLMAEREAPMPGTKGEIDESLYLCTDDFSVQILDSVSQLVKSYDSFAALKADGELFLPAGKYTIKAFSGENPDAGFDVPYYEGDTTCIVSAKEVVKIEANCRLANKKVQFEFSDRFFDQFRSDYMVVVDNGSGVLTISSEELRSAYFKNTGTLRFTVYTATNEGKTYSYSCDLSKDEQIKEHNNLYIQMDVVDAKPDVPANPDETDPEEPNEPSEPEDPEEPEDPNLPEEPDVPEVPVSAPTIKVDISLIERNYIIEIPSDFVETDKPDIPGGDDEPGSDDEPGGDETDPATANPEITGTINGKTFDVNAEQKVSASTKSVVINLYLPTGLDGLDVDVAIGDIKLSLDLLNSSSLDEINGILNGMGKNLTVPARGEKGNLKFDISPFLDMLDTDNTFKIVVKDKNGKKETAIIRLKK